MTPRSRFSEVSIRGASENNLKGVSIALPLGKMSCLAGVSGSGKSSLVEECLVVEADRRLEALNGRSRHFPLPYRPAIDSAELPFTILVSQGVLRWNARSTVGTASGIIPALRTLMLPFCTVRARNGEAAVGPDARTVAKWLSAQHPDASVSTLALIGRRVLGPLGPRIDAAVAAYPKALICVVETGQDPDVSKAAAPGRHRSTVARTQRDLYAVTAMGVKVRDRGALEAAMSSAFGLIRYPAAVKVLLEDSAHHQLIDLEGTLVHQTEREPLLQPNETLLSFNSVLPRSGRCSTCEGLGEINGVASAALIRDETEPLAYGGLAIPFDARAMRYRYFAPLSEELAGLLAGSGLKPVARWKDLSAALQESVMRGDPRIIQPLSPDGRPRGKKKPFVGVVERVEQALAGASAAVDALAHLRRRSRCPECRGSRLNYAARRVHVGETSLDILFGLSLEQLLEWLPALSDGRSGTRSTTIDALRRLLVHCRELGLGHLALLRPTASVSGGEGQRLRIARGLVERVASAAYVLDEPTRGLHAVDSLNLVNALENLLRPDSAVILVEHNPIVLRSVDHVVELGPGAGPDGGTVIYEGDPRGVPALRDPDSVESHSPQKGSGWISLEGVDIRNVRQQSFRLPTGAITCFTGVSGSGKTTVVRDSLRPALDAWLAGTRGSGTTYRTIDVSGQALTGVLHVPQLALTDNPRSLVLTYLGLADDFRPWFADASGADSLGIHAGHLSPNTTDGACRSCDGLGTTSLEGDRLAMRCGGCNGSGLRPIALFPSVLGKNVSEWLSLPASALVSQGNLPARIGAASRLLDELGLGHISLGRRIPTLSGGESQRLRITAALLDFETARDRARENHFAFLLDEPAAGLHIADVRKLMSALRRVVSGNKHTVILVEHSLYMIGQADWLVEMGPGAAADGGKVMFQGSPSEMRTRGPRDSLTRKALLGDLPRTGKRTRDWPTPETSDDGPGAAFQPIPEEKDHEDDTPPALTHPTFALDSESTSGYAHDTLALVGAALPLYTIFAESSSTSGGMPYKDEATLLSAARSAIARAPDAMVGFFPATQLAANERVTWPDMRRAIDAHLAAGAWGWFDGAEVSRRRSKADGGPEKVQAARMVMAPGLELEVSLARAIALGEGWISIVSPKTNRVDDFSLRAVDGDRTRVGKRWQVPQIFDRASRLASCELCDGAGTVAHVDEKLVRGDAGKPVTDLRFFTKLAGEALKAALRKRMLPALTRLAESGLIDLTLPYDQLDEMDRAALWFGYPGKEFLAQGGRPDVKGDWYRWRGLVGYILSDVWRVSDRTWSEAVVASRHSRGCPECGGTGLGWEARQRRVGSTSLQDIMSKWTLGRLRDWIDEIPSSKAKAFLRLRQSVDVALASGLRDVRCGSRLAELEPKHRLLARAIAYHENELSGAIVVIKPGSPGDKRLIEQFLQQIRSSTRMRWVFEESSPRVG